MRFKGKLIEDNQDIIKNCWIRHSYVCHIFSLTNPSSFLCHAFCLFPHTEIISNVRAKGPALCSGFF